MKPMFLVIVFAIMLPGILMDTAYARSTVSPEKTWSPRTREASLGYSAYPQSAGSVGQDSVITSKSTHGEKPMISIEQGKPVEQELAGGETHNYQIKIAARQFLRVAVYQRGINVLVTLFDPEGKQIVEMDGESSTQGQEEVLFIAAASGSYRLEVRSPEKRVKAGKYEVKIEELREATRKDTDRIAAQTIFLDGFKLNSQEKAEPLREAA